MVHLFAVVAAMALQGGVEERIRTAVEALDRSQKEFRMNLVELGPGAIPSLEKRLEGPNRELVKQAIEEIRRLKEPIERLVAQLGTEELAGRDKASAELLKIGRPARSYLEKVRSQADGEVKARAELLYFVIRPPRRDRDTWKREVEYETTRLADAEMNFERGQTTKLQVVQVRQSLDRARWKTGEIPVETYLKSARERWTRQLEWAEREHATGANMKAHVLHARLQGLYVDRRLGKDVEAEIRTSVLEIAAFLKTMGKEESRPYLDRVLNFVHDEEDEEKLHTD